LNSFDKLELNNNELENNEILLEVLDFNEFGANLLIGLYSIGLSTLFRNVNSEIFNTWLPLIHPEKGLEP
jgi:hypothetical protein